MKETRTLQVEIPQGNLKQGQNQDLSPEQKKPFAWVALIYGLVGSMVMLGFTPEPYSALTWFLKFYLLSILNLFFLSKVVAVTLGLMSHQGTEKGHGSMFHLCFYGAMKFLLLGGLLVLIWKSETAPMLSKMMGLAGLVAVPFFGGFWMSQKDFKNA